MLVDLPVNRIFLLGRSVCSAWAEYTAHLILWVVVWKWTDWLIFGHMLTVCQTDNGSPIWFLVDHRGLDIKLIGRPIQSTYLKL